MTTDLAAARPHMAVLSEALAQAGAIRTKPWAAAFAALPRHLFVPRWYEQETDARGIAVWRERHSGDADALAAAYRDVTLVTALDPDTAQQVDATAWTGVATSSSTQPSLMAGMLEDLVVEDGHRVLEIGTGTGYNAALLSHRLGGHLVHSVDVDPALTSAAQEHLAAAGYAPQLVPGDGLLGYPTGGPFDRIIATCSVPAVPDAWVRQLRPGGVLVADLALGIKGGIVRLTRRGDEVRGLFTENAGRFMPARAQAATYPAPVRSERAPTAGTRPTRLTAAEIRSEYPLRLVLSFNLPDTKLVYHRDDNDALSLQLQDGGGSWARVPLAGDTATVTFGGSTDLWKRAEDAHTWWCEAGQPDQSRFGYAVTAGGAYAWYLPDDTMWTLSD
ncbi:methyltransferase domain-containing protein [Streptomyces sp. NPDC093252]|uniref:methyltransferase domain-containing protein n=1 Tax=Streptomyces sp. NPDC093252 TaxID=3154980 RepID=UPI003443315A